MGINAGLANTYYVLGIIFFVLCIGMLVFLLLSVLYIKHKIDEIQKSIEEKINTAKEVAAHTPDAFTQGIGAFVINALSYGLRQLFRRG